MRATTTPEKTTDGAAKEGSFSVPVWTRSVSQPEPTFAYRDEEVWVLFSEPGPLEDEIRRMARLGVVALHFVRKGDGFRQLSTDESRLNPTSLDDYLKLFSHWSNLREDTATCPPVDGQ
jgi:hypothetical protein